MARRFTLITRAALTAAGLAGLLAALVAPTAALASAPASHHARSARAVTRSVFLAAHPRMAYRELSARDKRVFDHAFRHPHATTYAGPAVSSAHPAVRPTTRSQGSTGGGGGAGCWSRYYYKKWSDFGFHEGDTWMQLNWCNDTLGHFSKTSVSNAGGEGFGGVVYDGEISSGSRTTSGSYRAYREFKFSFGKLTEEPCIQVRGYTGGSSSTSTSCNLS